jgi:rod shape-determining protein MreC
MKKRIPKKAVYIAGGVLAVILVIILLSKIKTDSISSALVKIQEGLAKNIFYVKDTFKSIRYVSSAKTGIQALAEKNLFLDLQNQSLMSENERLKKILQMKTENSFKQYTKCFATVIDSNDDGFIQYYLIDRGVKNGVDRGDGVVSAAGVLGRISSIMPDSSRVQLLTDAESRISVRVERNKLVGILIGKGFNLCELDYVPKEEDIVEGDVLVTSGLGKAFPEGLKVGKVIKVDKKTDGLSMTVKVKPYASVFNIQEVIVVGRK